MANLPFFRMLNPMLPTLTGMSSFSKDMLKGLGHTDALSAHSNLHTCKDVKQSPEFWSLLIIVRSHL